MKKSTITTPDGTTTITIEGPDPRFGIQAPFNRSLSVKLPSLLTFNRTVTRTVAFSDPLNPLSLTNETTTTNINGRNFVRSYTAANRTFTFTSPLNRQAITVIDLLGRPTQTQTANHNATSFSYDARGRLANITRGTGVDSRMSTFAYNPAGFLANITDALNRVTSFSYDLAGRVTQRSLPGGRVIAYGYDANGNLTSITPPRRPAHVFAFTSINQISGYTPPAVPGGGQTTYAYNLEARILAAAFSVDVAHLLHRAIFREGNKLASSRRHPVITSHQRPTHARGQAGATVVRGGNFHGQIDG